MARIANLQVVLTGVTRDFEKSMQRAWKSAQSLEGHIKSLTRTVLAFGTTLTGVAAAGGLAAFIKRGLDSAAALNDLSSQLGMTIEDIKAFGTASGSIETGTSALQVFTRTIGEAIGGSKEARAAFEGLGISIKELASGTTGENLRRVFDALGKKDAASRAAAARDVFGRGSGALTWLAQGGGKFEKALEDIQRTKSGIVAGMAAEADEAVFAWDRVKTVFGAIGEQISVSIAPYMKKLAEDSISWVESLGGVPGIIDRIGAAWSGIADGIDRFTLGVRSIWNYIAGGVAKTLQGALLLASKVAWVVDLVHGEGSQEFYENMAASAGKDAERFFKLAGEQQDKALGAKSMEAGAVYSWLDDVKRGREMQDPELAKLRANWRAEQEKDARLAALRVAEEKKAAEDHKKVIKELTSDLKTLENSVASPFEKFQEELKTLDNGLKEHLITFDKWLELFDKLKHKSFSEDKLEKWKEENFQWEDRANKPSMSDKLRDEMLEYGRKSMLPAELVYEKYEKIRQWQKELIKDDKMGLFKSDFEKVVKEFKNEFSALKPTSRGGFVEEFNPEFQLGGGVEDRNKIPQLDKTNILLEKIRDGIFRLTEGQAFGFAE